MTGMEHTIEKAAQVLNDEGAHCGDCGREPGEPLSGCPDCERFIVGYARALAEAGLLSADPDLAATLVWPYGRKPGRDGAHRIGGRTIRPAGVYVEMDGYEMRPETAVDLARALLAAAEDARWSDGNDRLVHRYLTPWGPADGIEGDGRNEQ